MAKTICLFQHTNKNRSRKKWWQRWIKKHKKAKGVNKNIVATISHSENKDDLLNKKCLRHSVNRIQSKDHKIGKFLCLALMIKYASKTMGVMD